MKDDYSYWSENLHSAYLFYTLEVDKLNKENKRLKTELEILVNTNSKQEIYNVIHENTNFHKKNREVNQENQRLREALESITDTYFKIHGGDGLYACYKIAKQALGDTCD